MSESFITQCPHCQTSFRVNQAQLGAANGAVRCGTCLKVFNALQQMQGGNAQAAKPTAPVAAPSSEARPAAPRPATAGPSAPARPAPQAPAGAPPAPGPSLGWPLAPHSARPAADSAATAAPAPAKPADETLWIHDDLDLDSLNLDEELAKLDAFELSQEFRALQAAPKPAEALLNGGQKSRDPHDERWAEALLEEERQASPGTRQEPRLGRIEEAEEQAPAVEAAAAATETPARAGAEAEEEDNLPSLSARRDDEEPPAEAGEAGAAGEAPLSAPATLPAPAAQREAPSLGSALEGAGDAQPQRADPGLGESSLHDLTDEPLQLDWQKPKGRWGRRLLWSLLILLALGGLAGQYVTYHFDELAREDAYRPWFAELCPQLGCKLPSKVDVEQIRSSNLVVRSHPDFSGALVVDAIIYNRASFSQPFPLLELRFADLNGQLIASRSFKPGEYLAGELAGQTEMPPQTPIHISLDILDPGAKAVNYSLSFHSPE